MTRQDLIHQVDAAVYAETGYPDFDEMDEAERRAARAVLVSALDAGLLDYWQAGRGMPIQADRAALDCLEAAGVLTVRDGLVYPVEAA